MCSVIVVYCSMLSAIVCFLFCLCLLFFARVFTVCVLCFFVACVYYVLFVFACFFVLGGWSVFGGVVSMLLFWFLCLFGFSLFGFRVWHVALDDVARCAVAVD